MKRIIKQMKLIKNLNSAKRRKLILNKFGKIEFSKFFCSRLQEKVKAIKENNQSIAILKDEVDILNKKIIKMNEEMVFDKQEKNRYTF